jgi:hypothetical protein
VSAQLNRRQFIPLLGGAAAAWPVAAHAQQAAKVPTIGYLGATTRSVESQRVAALMQRLREFGWIEGRNFAIEYRWGEGRSERFAEFATEFVQLKVDLIVTYGTAAILAAKQATSDIPIVFPVAGDPVGSNLVGFGEAVQRPRMRFVPVKTAEQQASQLLHRGREQLVRQRTILVNALRAHLAEFGLVAARRL